MHEYRIESTDPNAQEKRPAKRERYARTYIQTVCFSYQFRIYVYTNIYNVWRYGGYMPTSGIFIICVGFPHIIYFHLLYYLRFIFFPISGSPSPRVFFSTFFLSSFPVRSILRARGLRWFLVMFTSIWIFFEVGFSLLLHFSLCKQHITHIFFSPALLLEMCGFWIRCPRYIGEAQQLTDPSNKTSPVPSARWR